MDHKPSHAFRFTALILLLALLLSCNLPFFTVTQPTPTTPPPTAAPTQTMTPEPGPPVDVPLRSATPPENAPLPSAAPPQVVISPTPQRTSMSAALTSTGPWLLVRAESGLWAANSDGSGATLLTNDRLVGPDNLNRGVSPAGHAFAYITGDEDRIHNLTLKLLTLPGGQIKTITKLTNSKTEPDPGAVMLDDKIEAVRAVSDMDSLDWSPDGKTLAFIGVQDGPSADLYTYSLDTGKITRLSDGPSQAYNPVWSPDGKWIVHFGTTSFGTGAGHPMSGGWAARGDGSSILTLFNGGPMQEFQGFVNDHQFLINTWSPANGPQDLRLYDINNQKQVTLEKGVFSGAAAAPVTGLVLVGADENAAQPGLFAFGPENTTRRQISSQPTTVLKFNPAGGDFLVSSGTQERVYNVNGEQVAEEPAISCKYGVGWAGYGALYAWTCASGPDNGVWVNGPGVETRKIFDGPALLPMWSPDNTLLFFQKGNIFRAFFFEYVPEPASGVSGDALTAAWVP